jgi:hypothetical protein
MRSPIIKSVLFVVQTINTLAILAGLGALAMKKKQ